MIARTAKGALALLGAVSLASCAQILGFEEHEPYPDGGAQGTSGGGSGGGDMTPPHFGAPETIATGQAGPSDLALDTASVYWVNTGLSAGSAQIMGLPRSGGSPAQIAFMQPALMGLAIDATRAVCAEPWQAAGYSTISIFGKGGSTKWPTELYTHAGATYLAFAMQGTVVAWASSESGGSVFRGDTQGSAEIPVATMQGHVGSVALDGATTYWVSTMQGAIVRDKGGTIETVAGGQASATDLTLDSENVYWTSNDGTVKMLPKASPGGDPTVIASDALSPQRIVVDATNVYWAENDAGGRVRTAPRGGGKVETLATGQYAFAVAVDASAVYATLQGDGTVVRIPKQ